LSEQLAVPAHPDGRTGRPLRGEITILCPNSVELQLGRLDALLKQPKQGIVDQ
jgi:hypothetical protein